MRQHTNLVIRWLNKIYDGWSHTIVARRIIFIPFE